MSRINVTQSVLPDRAEFDAYVTRIFEAGWLTNRGELVKDLEKRLEAHLGVRNVVLVYNGTVALQIAYKLLGLNGEIVTTPFSFIATASSAVWEGLNVVFADIDSESFCIDVDQISKRLTERTSAILPVHIFGNPCDVEVIDQIADEKNLRVIYDAAHAFGIDYEGSSVLNWGDVSILSFHATKLFHTVEGGALIIDDDELCESARKMINFGITGPEDIECLGINAKMNELQAAMGLCLLDGVKGDIARREQLAGIYDSALTEIVTKQRWRDGATNNFGYHPILLNDEGAVQRVSDRLNEYDVYPRRYFYPSLDTLDFLGPGQHTPAARDISRRIICLPMFPQMSDEQCLTVSKLVRQVLAEE